MRPDTLTQSQQAIVAAIDPHITVLSGAGTGKTTVIAAKVTDRLRTGTLPQQIVLLTYTAAGQLSLRQRLSAFGITSAQQKKLQMHLLHDFARGLLKRAEPENRQTIYDDTPGHDLQTRVSACWAQALDILQQHDLLSDQSSPQLFAQLSDVGDAFKHNPHASLFLLEEDAAEPLSPRALAEQHDVSPAVVRAIVQYENQRVGGGPDTQYPQFRTDVDCVYDLLRTLRDAPALLADALHDIRLLCIDEAHDLSPAWQDALPRLPLRQTQFMAVGDWSQRVYASAGFRIQTYRLQARAFQSAAATTVLALNHSLRFGHRITHLINHLKRTWQLSGGFDDLLQPMARLPAELDAVHVLHLASPRSDPILIDNPAPTADRTHSSHPAPSSTLVFDAWVAQALATVQAGCDGFKAKGSSKRLLLIVPQQWHVPTAALCLARQQVDFSVLGKDEARSSFWKSSELTLLKAVSSLFFPCDGNTSPRLLNDAFAFWTAYFGLKRRSVDATHAAADLLGLEPAFDEVRAGRLALHDVLLQPAFANDFVTRRAAVFQSLARMLTAFRQDPQQGPALFVQALSLLDYQRWLQSQYLQQAQGRAAVACVQDVLAMLTGPRALGLADLRVMLHRFDSTHNTTQWQGWDVQLTSAAESKGHQADVVFVGPLSHTLWSVGDAELEQNRLYVAASRAQHRLYLMLPSDGGGDVHADRRADGRLEARLDARVATCASGLLDGEGRVRDFNRAADAEPVAPTLGDLTLSATGPAARSKISEFRLNVPYDQRDLPRRYGAVWNPAIKRWVLRAEICPAELKGFLG